jgi:hypothetical protein
MAEVDYVLVHEAESFITGANAHRIRQWIACYQLAPTCAGQARYERLLRDFVTSQKLDGYLKKRRLATHPE